MSGAVTTGDGLPVAVPHEPAGPEIPAAPQGPAPQAQAEPDRHHGRRIALLLLLLALLMVLVGIAVWYFLFRQPITLPAITTPQMPGYTTSIYGVANPIGVAVSSDGARIYVAETEDQRVVRIFDASGKQVGTAAPPASSGDHVPVWLAIDPITSSLYVSDRPTGSIYVYDADGGFQRALALPTPIPGWQPMGIAFDTAGNLYVADAGGTGARVEEFDRSLKLVMSFGASDRLSFPNGVAVDKTGDVFVADSNNGRLMAYRADGTSLGNVGRGAGQGELGLPRGVTVDGKGWIYVGDSTAQGVFVFRLATGGSSALEYLGFLGGPGTADGRFSYPNGVAADGRGRIYVSDTGNGRVQLWSY